MTHWKPIEDASTLPQPGTEESEHVDFKREPWDRTDSGKLELLRDVAQFANHLGGSLVIGAQDSPDRRLIGYVDVEETEKVERRVTQACYERLSPRVEVGCAILTTEGHRVLVVNVPASIGPVRIKVSGTERWEFYRRHGKLKHPISFEEVERMWSDYRRGRILLSKVPEGAPIYVDPSIADSAFHMMLKSPAYLELHEGHFTIVVSQLFDVNLPYEAVRAVWPRVGGGWSVSLAARLESENGRPVGRY